MALTDNLIAYWKLDGDLTDATGGGHTLTNNNTVSLAGAAKLGSASADFENTSHEWLSSTSTDFNVTGDLSLSMWVKVESVGTEIQYMMLNWQDSGDRSWLLVYYVVADANQYKFRFSANPIGTGFGTSAYTSAQDITDGSWYHIAAVYDASAGTCTVYVDGSPLTAASGLDTSLYGSASKFAIGGRSGDADSNQWDGLIDEVGFWDRTLTSDEVTELYNSGAGLAYPFTGGAAHLHHPVSIGAPMMV